MHNATSFIHSIISKVKNRHCSIHIYGHATGSIRAASQSLIPNRKSHAVFAHSVAFNFWWASRESNTAPTDYAYQLQLSLPLSGLWSGLSLVFTTCPYSLYTFSRFPESFARDCHGLYRLHLLYKPEVSPNLSNSTKGQSELTPRQPIWCFPCSSTAKPYCKAVLQSLRKTTGQVRCSNQA